MRLFSSIALLLCPLTCFAISDKDFFKIQQALRQVDAHTIKSNVARFDEKKPVPHQKNNGDEWCFCDKRGNFNKALCHLPSGFPNVAAYNSLVKALQTGEQCDFNSIKIGIGEVKLVNPQGSLAYSLAGNDAWINAICPAPNFASAETAGEMVELYWTVLVRDVPFNEFDSDALVEQAIDNLNSLCDFRGPRINGLVTPQTFLRGCTPGDIVGPYISQFLYQPIPYGNTFIEPTALILPEPSTDNDFLTELPDWCVVINGGLTGKEITPAPGTSFIKTPRDLAEYVHVDSPGQAALSALLLLISYNDPDVLDPNNPYRCNCTQDGFVTFNISDVLALMRNAVQEGLKAAWYQKWQVNRRCRPEEYGFYLNTQLTEGVNLCIHPDLLNSPALSILEPITGTYLLPSAYPEGCPAHPSYPAGHATLMGAAVTILKAFFNEDCPIRSPMAPNPANTILDDYTGPTLYIGGELNKLAANISLGRDHAGVHYRSDGIQGLLLGEKVAIDVLNNNSFLFNEDFKGFHLTKFDGTKILVGHKRNTKLAAK